MSHNFTSFCGEIGKWGDILEWLKSRRKELGFTQNQIAKLSGIKQGYYTQIENGVRNPSVRLAKKLGEILGVEWTKFFD